MFSNLCVPGAAQGVLIVCPTNADTTFCIILKIKPRDLETLNLAVTLILVICIKPYKYWKLEKTENRGFGS